MKLAFARTSEPIKFGLLLLPIAVGAVFADSWLVKGLLMLLWTGGVGAVAALAIAEVRYSQELVNRMSSGNGGRAAPAPRR